jgi:hypothetical protein
MAWQALGLWHATADRYWSYAKGFTDCAREDDHKP